MRGDCFIEADLKMRIKVSLGISLGLVFSGAVGLAGCASFGFLPSRGFESAQRRIITSEIGRQEISVPRLELARRIRERGTGEGVRLIPILKGQSYEMETTPEYRIFNVKKGGVYELLGLKNADVIISAHDYVIRDPRAFPQYIALLKGQQSSSIEIRRDGSPLLLAIKITD